MLLFGKISASMEAQVGSQEDLAFIYIFIYLVIILFILIHHKYDENNKKRIDLTMARRPKGNYEAYIIRSPQLLFYKMK